MESGQKFENKKEKRSAMKVLGKFKWRENGMTAEKIQENYEEVKKKSLAQEVLRRAIFRTVEVRVEGGFAPFKRQKWI